MGKNIRRRDKEITDTQGILEIFRKGKFCHLAMVDDGEPYLITMNYGYRENALYFHAALEGRKIDVLRASPEVCFQVVTETRLTTGEDACDDWTMKYKSVVGYGRVVFIETEKEKIEALNILMDQYTTRGPFEFKQKRLDETAIFKVEITSLTGKMSGY
jgi:nitroimidazol reductase NimA-like FMN-containing flavoprotein (pyridoxamine 5'-phosphate oxidase superfamily)